MSDASRQDIAHSCPGCGIPVDGDEDVVYVVGDGVERYVHAHHAGFAAALGFTISRRRGELRDLLASGTNQAR